MNSMFSKCSSLKELPDISKWNTSNIKNINFMFYNCSSLKSLPNIKKFQMNNVSYISGIFAECSNLISIRDISYWMIEPSNNLKHNDESYPIYLNKIFKRQYEDNYLYIRYMFYNCSSLKKLPDISKWNTNKVYDISYLFHGCNSLLYYLNFQNGIQKM